MAVVLSIWVALVGAIHLHSLVDAITRSVHGQALARIFDAEVFLVLASIHLDERGTVTPVEARVLTRAEFVEFIHNVVQLLAKRV